MAEDITFLVFAIISGVFSVILTLLTAMLWYYAKRQDRHSIESNNKMDILLDLIEARGFDKTGKRVVYE